MLIEQRQFEDGSILGLWHITEDVDELLNILDNDPFVIEHISQFTSIKRKQEFLASRCALNELTGERLTITYTETGHPVIENKAINISISHTGEWVTVLLHPTKRVGIDIERLTDKLIRVKNKFLSDRELSILNQQNEKPQLAIMWATKEALYKLLDIKELDPIKDIHIEPFTAYLDGTLSAYESKTKERKQFQMEYVVRPEYVIVKVVEN